MNIKGMLCSNAFRGRRLYRCRRHACTPNLVAVWNPWLLPRRRILESMEVSISSSVVVVEPDTDAESVSAGLSLLPLLTSGSGSPQTVPLTMALRNITDARAVSAFVPAVPAGGRAGAPLRRGIPPGLPLPPALTPHPSFCNPCSC